MKAGQKEILIISYLDYPYSAGLCTRITGLANVLAGTGVKVGILAPIARGDFQLPEKEQRNNYCVERINLIRFTARNSGDFGPRLLQWLIFSIVASFKVAKNFIKSGSLIQYQSTYSAIPALFAKIFLKAKIIGDDIVLINPFIDVLILKLSDVVVTPSLRTYSFAKNLRTFTLYVPNGVEQNLCERRSSHLKTKVLFIGSLSFDQNLKAVENIIKITSRLDKKMLTFDVIVVGGPLTYVEHLINHPIVQKGKVTFVGQVSNDKLTELYGSSLIGLLPFFSNTSLKGGQRTKALEFFANRLLVISGPEGVKGIHGLKPGKHYLLVNSLDKMCAIIDKCLSEPQKYQNIATAGASYISENYSWETLTKDYVGLIQGSISKS